jgi:anion-transporting  ArsA/GET3 family ATPase
MREIHGMMYQMGGMMEHMVDRIQAAPLTPEQTKQMGEMMGHMADMMQKLSGMTGSEAPQQMAPMMERMTEMHKRMMSMMAVPPAAPQQDKK